MPVSSALPPAAEVTAIILAGGSGDRLGGTPKAFLHHRGATLLDHAHALLAPFACRVVACLPADRLDEAREDLIAIAGGASRQASVMAGLAVAETPYVLLHEVARPFASPELVRDVLAALVAGADAAVPVVPLPVRDSLIRLEQGRIAAVLAREEMYSSQTPQSYRRVALNEALDAAMAQARDETTAFAPMLRAGARVDAVAAAPGNVKITYPEDLALLDPDEAP